MVVVKEKEAVEGGVVEEIGVVLLLGNCGVHELEEVAVAVRAEESLGMGLRDEIDTHITFVTPVCLPFFFVFFLGPGHRSVGGAAGAAHCL